MTDSDQFEHSKIQLVGSLNAVAESLRSCATIADHFAQVVKNTPFSSGATLQVIHKSSPQPKAGKRKAKAIEEDPADPDGKKKPKTKKQKKTRDPDMPKRPASSYLLFQNEIRKELKSKNPEMTQTELLSMIAKQWAEMSLEQKLVYTAATATAKERYHQEKAAYDAKVPSVATGVATSPTPAAPAPAPAPAPVPPTPAAKSKKNVKSLPTIPSSDSGSSVSASEESSEEDDDDEEDDEEVVVEVQKPSKEQPSKKKAKRAIRSRLSDF